MVVLINPFFCQSPDHIGGRLLNIRKQMGIKYLFPVKTVKTYDINFMRRFP